jgi:polyhydroxyalkanoate synthesis regulator phasin
MAENLIKRLVDAGVEFTGLSQAKAESLVRKLVRDGQVRRRDAEATVATLVGKGRETAETFVVSLQREVSQQLDRLTSRVDEVERRVEELVSGLVARSTTGAAPVADDTAPVTESPVPPAKKAAAVKKAAPVKKAPAKRGAAKQAPGATGPSGVRRVSTGAR